MFAPWATFFWAHRRGGKMRVDAVGSTRINVARVETLQAAGRMRPGGVAEVEAAKADGRWEEAYESQRTASIPGELETTPAGSVRAHAGFQHLSRSDRYALMLPMLKARTPETRAKALAVAMAQLTAQDQGGSAPDPS